MAAPRKARRAYRAFHGHDVESRKRARLVVPKKGETLWALGDLVAIVYKRPGEKVPYEHVFKKPMAKLATDARGRRLYIVGGGYRVTARGIVR